jgi:FKBP-type peptidyl-prolyl cis-trans isomerase
MIGTRFSWRPYRAAAKLITRASYTTDNGTTKFPTTESKASYGLGLKIGVDLANTSFKGVDETALYEGISDGLHGRTTQVEVETLRAALTKVQQAMREADAEKKQPEEV